MKPSKLLLLVALLATPLLSHCLVVDESGNPVTGTPPSPNVSGSAQQSNQVYDLGLEKGFADGRGGQSRNPGRHAGSYPAAESDAFNIGYEKGYNQGIR